MNRGQYSQIQSMNTEGHSEIDGIKKQRKKKS